MLATLAHDNAVFLGYKAQFQEIRAELRWSMASGEPPLKTSL